MIQKSPASENLFTSFHLHNEAARKDKKASSNIASLQDTVVGMYQKNLGPNINATLYILPVLEEVSGFFLNEVNSSNSGLNPFQKRLRYSFLIIKQDYISYSHAVSCTTSFQTGLHAHEPTTSWGAIMWVE